MSFLVVSPRRMIKLGVSAEEIFSTISQLAAFYDNLCKDGFTETPLEQLKSLDKLGQADLLAYLFPLGMMDPDGSADASQVEIPSLNIAGWYDCFQQSTIDNFINARAGARGLGRQAYLLVGPWTHGKVESTVGDLDFGLASAGAAIELKQDLTAVHLLWFDHWLKGMDNGVEQEPPVKLFLTGANTWITLDNWPPTNAVDRPYYLHGEGLLKLEKEERVTLSSQYIYDPTNPVPTLGGNTLLPGVYPPGVKDQRPLLNRSDVLAFMSEPLEQAITVLGRVKAEIWVSSTAPDTDFVVRLLDIHPDGFIENIADGIQRTRSRKSSKEPLWLEPGEVVSLDIDLWSVGHVFPPGHKLGVMVTSSSFPRWDRNWNTKEEPWKAVSGNNAVQTLWHDASHPSCIYLPLVESLLSEGK